MPPVDPVANKVANPVARTTMGANVPRQCGGPNPHGGVRLHPRLRASRLGCPDKTVVRADAASRIATVLKDSTMSTEENEPLTRGDVADELLRTLARTSAHRAVGANDPMGPLLAAARQQPQAIVQAGTEYVLITKAQLYSHVCPPTGRELAARFRKSGLPLLTFD
jgi:hypothetical protein